MSELWAQLVELLVQFQGEIVVAVSAVITSVVVSYLAKRYPGFAGLSDKVKRAVLFLSAVLVSALVSLVGGVPNIDLAAILVGGALASGAAGTVFKVARTTPTTEAASLARRDDF